MNKTSSSSRGRGRGTGRVVVAVLSFQVFFFSNTRESWQIYIIPLLLKNYVNILDMFFPCISDTVDIFGNKGIFKDFLKQNGSTLMVTTEN
jgi:hypothetical protein